MPVGLNRNKAVLWGLWGKARELAELGMVVVGAAVGTYDGLDCSGFAVVLQLAHESI